MLGSHELVSPFMYGCTPQNASGESKCTTSTLLSQKRCVCTVLQVLHFQLAKKIQQPSSSTLTYMQTRSDHQPYHFFQIWTAARKLDLVKLRLEASSTSDSKTFRACHIQLFVHASGLFQHPDAIAFQQNISVAYPSVYCFGSNQFE